MPRRIVGIDALRGLCAIAVFVCHVAGYFTFMHLPGKLPQLAAVGAHGVDVFVVLSGFCLTLPLTTDMGRLRVRAFLGRRAWRILPAYWIALIFAFVIAVLPATWPHSVAQQATVTNLAVHTVGLQNVFTPQLATINGSLWSIALEIQLYLTFPFVVLLWRRAGVAVVVASAAALTLAWSLAGRWVSLSGTPFAGLVGEAHTLPARLVQFTAGVAVAIWIGRGGVMPRRHSVVIAVGAVIGATVISTRFTATVADLLAWGAAGAAAVLAVASSSLPSWANRLELFGRRSFSFYLLHQPIVLLVAIPVAHLHRWPIQTAIGGGVAFAITAGLAEVLYRRVEVPSHEIGRRRFGRIVDTATEPDLSTVL